MRQPPQPGEKWRHFKGGEYWVIAICTVPYTGLPMGKIIYSKTKYDQTNWGHYTRVFDAESPTVFWMSRSKKIGELILMPSNEIWHSKDVSNKTLWGRPLDNFMEVLHDENETSQYHRFERISKVVDSVEQE